MKKILILIFNLLSISLFSQTNIYWENEKILASGNIGVFKTICNQGIAGVFFADTTNKYDLFFSYSKNGSDWLKPMKIIDRYFSNNPNGDDFAAQIDKDNNIYLCYRENDKKFNIVKISYPYEEKKISSLIEILSPDSIYLPEMFLDSSNELNLILTNNRNDRFILEYKKISSEGKLISQNVISENFNSSINPKMSEYNGVLYLFFQAKINTIESGYFYNIIMGTSRDNGKSWSFRRIVTSKGENNQGPNFTINNNICYLVWEKEDKNYVSHIYYKYFNINSENFGNEILISDNSSEAHYPYILFYNNELNIFWYDNKAGNFQNIFTQVIGENILEKIVIKPKKGRTLQNRPFVFKKDMIMFWNQLQENNTLYYLKTDTSVAQPYVLVKGLTDENLTNQKNITIEWKSDADPSGIKGYKVLLTQNKDEKIPKEMPVNYYKNNTLEYSNLNDGNWFFKIKAYDNAGNESDEKIFDFGIDTNPPRSPEIIDPEKDQNGALKNNSLVIGWKETNKPVKYYQYNYKIFEDNNFSDIEKFKRNLSKNDFKNTTDKSLNLQNLDNGTLVFGLKAADKAGNVSDINWKEYKLSHFVFSTEINYISSRMLENGKEVINIYGKGFKTDGVVTKIIIDRDGKPPYDYEMQNNNFTIESDRLIQQLKSIDVKDGNYFIGVEHSVRGIKFFDKSFNFSGKWVFKYEDENNLTFNKVFFMTQRINLTAIIFILLGIFWLAIFILLSFSIINVLNEKAYIKKIISRLDTMKGKLPADEFNKRRKLIMKKNMGLTLKYTLLILVLVITIVSATSITLSALTLRNETINLANEMKERSNLVMTNFETTMRDIYTFEKGFSEAVDSTTNYSTLPDIGFTMFREPDGRIFLRFGEKVNVFFKGLKVEKLSDAEKENVIKDKVFTKNILDDIEQFKTNYDNKVKIYPNFDPAHLKNNYIFIKPIFTMDTKRFSSVIVIGYSYEKILNLINSDRMNLIKITILVTFIAILISIFGAIFLATTTIRPIKRMSKHVNVISLTEDYEKLLGTENEKIEVKTKDEIGILAFSINEMTQKLIEKAKADKQMMMGKEIQKKFIPLEPYEDEFLDIYGFYEGAKGVSGDYFDFKRLDNDHFAFIICDVAGKAVPAALIMVQISTIFHSFCSNFNPRTSKIETVNIVNTINDTVAERGFTGRFAAILVIILNKKTGKALLTNAGYTKVLIYRNKKSKTEWEKLNQDAGAAGVFPSDMLPEPYKQEELFIDKNDIIYLFTDGIEEARNGQVTKNDRGEKKYEEFGEERIREVLDKSSGNNPKSMIIKLIEKEKVFRGNEEQYDDLTLLGIKRK